MPQLKSGRHFAFGRPPLIERLKVGTDVEVYSIIVAYRLEVQDVGGLSKLLPIVYFREGEGTPPDAPRYLSGYTVRDVLAGTSDWCDSEIDELQVWIDATRTQQWLEALLAEINEVIVSSPIWTSELVTDEPEDGLPH